MNDSVPWTVALFLGGAVLAVAALKHFTEPVPIPSRPVMLSDGTAFAELHPAPDRQATANSAAQALASK